MRIRRLELRRVPPSWVWLIMHTDTEHIGLGEPFLEGQPEAVMSEVQRLEPVLIGRDPLDRERLWAELYRSGAGYRGGPVTMSAISGIDMALWDLAGKASGLSVAELLGGRTRDAVRMYRAAGGHAPAFPQPGSPYNSVAAPLPDTRDGWLRGITAAAALNFRTLKVHVNLGSSVAATTAAVDQVIERFAWAREAVGTDVELALDVHDPHPIVARQVIEGVAPLRPLFVEEPVPQERIAELELIARSTATPIAAGERWVGRWAFFEAMHGGGLAVAQPDLAHVGGFTEARRVAAIADATNTALAPHSPLSPLALAASIQFDAWADGFLVQEHNEVNASLGADRRYRIGRGYLRDPFVLREDGTVDVPNSAGLGVSLDLAGLEAMSSKPWSSIRG